MSAIDLGVAGSIACSVVFFVIAGLLVTFRRQQPPPVLPAMSDLGPETPAVANLLANGGRVTPDAVPATLFDLAARHAVKIEEPEQGTYACRIQATPAGALKGYESRVLDLLRKRAVGGVVPAKALTVGPSTEAGNWMKEFRKDVVTEASAAGKCAPRWPRQALWVMSLLALGALMLSVMGGDEDNTTTPQVVAMVIAFLTIVVLSKAFTEDIQMVTPAGVQSQARWLSLRKYLHDDELFSSLPPTAVVTRERYLAYGAALGVAAAAVRAIPMGAESDRWAWTHYGGQWRQVRVSYPNRWPPGWGSSPWQVGWAGLQMTAFGALVLWVTTQFLPSIEFGPGTGQAIRYFSVAVVLATGMGAVVCGLGLLVICLAVVSAVRTERVVGEAIRVRGFGDHEASRYYLAVYTGQGDHVRAWSVGAGIHSTIKEYEVVTVDVGPLFGYVRSVRHGAQK